MVSMRRRQIAAGCVNTTVSMPLPSRSWRRKCADFSPSKTDNPCGMPRGFLRRAERDDVFPCLNPLQPILHGGEPKTQISFLYCSQRKIVKPTPACTSGWQALNPLSLPKTPASAPAGRAGRCAAAPFFRRADNAALQPAASWGNRRSISTPTGRSAITASARWPQ